MIEYIFDIEADGLLDTISKVHCLSYSTVDRKHKGTLYSSTDIKGFLDTDNIFIGHYIHGYDFRALKKIYGIKEPKLTVDTLALSWYLHHDRSDHGLESYGEDYGVPKPVVNDWENLTIGEYTHRCETDVEINLRLWIDLKKKLQEIYS